MRDLAIYIHIPFCVRKCAYCDFLSAPPIPGQQDRYFGALSGEIQAAAHFAECYDIKTVFIGGGTPSFPDAGYIKEILNVLRKTFEDVRSGSYQPYEVTLECNPGTVSRDKLDIYAESGINRLSFGLQSADEVELKLLGRIHTFSDWCGSMDMARAAGFDNINVDLISGIPGQTAESFASTLDRTLVYGPEHISVYSLIIEEGTPFYNKYRTELYSEDENDARDEIDRRIYAMTGEALHKHGFVRYEISNYSKPGRECRHNLVYWERGDYLGFGLGAASLMDNTRYSNVSDVNIYIEHGNDRTCVDALSIERLSAEERMSEFVILGLRKITGISCREFARLYSKDIRDVFGAAIDRWVETGMLILKDDRLYCSEEGLNICSRIMADFM